MIKDFDKLKSDLRNLGKISQIQKPCVTFFGSARFDENNAYCKVAYDLAYKLAPHFGVITGGGGSIMKAANHGISEADGTSIGINIILPNEQKINPYAKEKFLFNHLSARKAALIMNAKFFVIFPGGFGTLDELFEVLTLRQTGFLEAEIFLYDKEYFSPLIKFFEVSLLKEKAINQDELNACHLCNSVDEIYNKILKYSDLI